jgi:hypothetical protein
MIEVIRRRLAPLALSVDEVLITRKPLAPAASLGVVCRFDGAIDHP